jgi:hypothetical protein
MHLACEMKILFWYSGMCISGHVHSIVYCSVECGIEYELHSAASCVVVTVVYSSQVIIGELVNFLAIVNLACK